MKTALLGCAVFWLTVLYFVASAFACDATCQAPSKEETGYGIGHTCHDRAALVRPAYREQVLADCVRAYKHRYEVLQ
jgi:hypothetical protein